MKSRASAARACELCGRLTLATQLDAGLCPTCAPKQREINLAGLRAVVEAVDPTGEVRRRLCRGDPPYR